MKAWVLRAAGLICALGAWQLTVSLMEPTVLPLPHDVISSFRDNPVLLRDGMIATAARLLVGLTSSFVIATTLALLAFRWSSLRHFVEAPIEIVRPIPPIALTPFFILLFGLGGVSQIGLIALGGFMIFYIGWLEALNRTPRALVLSARTLGIDGLALVLRVAMPYAWPAQKPIWRLAIATGLALSVAAEYLGAQGGLGFLIRNARTILDFDLVAACSILLGAIAIAIDRAVVLLIDMTSRWSAEERKIDD